MILGCDTRWLDDEELALNIARVSGFLNSIQPKTLIKIRASSQIPYLNPVEKMVMEQVNQPRSHNEKALLYSLHDLSSRTPKTTRLEREDIHFNVIGSKRNRDPDDDPYCPGCRTDYRQPIPYLQ